jgi:hypothetical protein
MRKADINKPAVTMYPKARRAVSDSVSVLKLAKNNKISDKGKLPIIKKGKFAGYVIFTLTLEERATCPRECYHWDNCYGNNMAFAHRFEHGAALENKLEQEIAELCATYKGVIVRLHVLGDFYSVDYVNLWQSLLCKYDNLAVWGYTGNLPNSPIGLAIRFVYNYIGDRFSVRFSNAPTMRFSANSNDLFRPVKGQSFICPEQTGAAANCANCALCWSAPDKQVLFMTH